jgi:acyl carrier protein
MSGLSAAEVRSFVVGHVEDRLVAVGLSADDVGDDFDLLTSGTIDSMGLIELLSAVEERFGVRADLSEIDTEDIGVVGPFCAHVANRARG